MASPFFLWTLSALVAVALVGVVVTLVLQVKSGSARDLAARLNSLELQFEEVINAVNKWTNRGRAAEARARIGQAAQAPAVPQRGTREYKQWLRSRAIDGGAT